MEQIAEGATEICSHPGCGNMLPLRPPSESLDPEVRQRLYKPLNAVKREIRLLRVETGDLTDGVSCSLFATPLFASPAPEPSDIHKTVDVYELLPRQDSDRPPASPESAGPFAWRTLSYVWGEADNATIVRVNGEPVPVGPNLHEALVWLRWHKYVSPIWIDALCIDQANPTERSTQVQMMGELYSLSWETLIYASMGCQIDTDPASLARMRDTSIFSSPRGFSREMSAWATGTPTDPAMTLFAAASRDSGRDAYWRRLWTVQEGVLARSSIVCSGPLLLPWWGIREFRYCTWSLFQQISASTSKVMVEQECIVRITRVLAGTFAERDALRRQIRRPDLQDIIIRLQGNHCSDLRDAIFAIAGLQHRSNDDTTSIKIDYTLCTGCVWSDAVLKIIAQTKRLDILGLCGTFHARSSPPTATWCLALPDLPYAANTWRSYNFWPEAEASVNFDHANTVLNTKGVVFGAISARTDFARDIRLPTRYSCSEVIATIKNLIQLHVADYEKRVSLYKNIARMTLDGHTIEHQAVITAIWTGEVSNVDELPKESISALISSCLYLDRYFVGLVKSDSKGPLFIFPNIDRVEDEDLICGVQACNLPLIVRRTQHGDIILGQCLIAGYGNGEIKGEIENNTRSLCTFSFI